MCSTLVPTVSGQSTNTAEVELPVNGVIFRTYGTDANSAKACSETSKPVCSPRRRALDVCAAGASRRRAATRLLTGPTEARTGTTARLIEAAAQSAASISVLRAHSGVRAVQARPQQGSSRDAHRR